MAKSLLLKRYRGAPAPVNGERAVAARLYAEAARAATSQAERDHLARQAARPEIGLTSDPG